MVVGHGLARVGNEIGWVAKWESLDWNLITVGARAQALHGLGWGMLNGPRVHNSVDQSVIWVGSKNGWDRVLCRNGPGLCWSRGKGMKSGEPWVHFKSKDTYMDTHSEAHQVWGLASGELVESRSSKHWQDPCSRPQSPHRKPQLCLLHHPARLFHPLPHRALMWGRALNYPTWEHHTYP